MREQTVSVTEMREKLADFIEQVDQGRILLTRHGQDRAYLISARELRALEETIAVLESEEMVASLAQGLKDLREGRVEPAERIFADLDAEFKDED